jgi:hypothetical protein
MFHSLAIDFYNKAIFTSKICNFCTNLNECLTKNHCTVKLVYNDHPWFGTPKLWLLLTLVVVEVPLCYQLWKWDPKRLVSVGRWVLYGGNRSIRFDCTLIKMLLSIYCCLCKKKTFMCFLLRHAFEKKSRNIRIREIKTLKEGERG